MASGRTTSVWMADTQMPELQPLAADTAADVCVVGAGIAGVTTAYELARAGKSVVVLEDGGIGSGETGRTTAHLTSALDDRFYELERLHGEDGARVAAASHAAAIDRVEAIVREEGIDCDFERLDGYLFVPPGDDVGQLERELEAARRAGLDAELVARAPIETFDTGRALRFPGQAQLHPLRYLASLAEAARRAGARFLQAHAAEIRGGADATVTTARGWGVRAGAIVVATNTPVNDLLEIHNKQAGYRTYVVGLRVPAGALPRALYWDTPDPYHYVRVVPLAGSRSGNPEADLVIVGGEDHRTGHALDGADRFERLVAWARERFPVLGEAYRWSGQVWEPVDSLGLIGRNPADEDNVYVVTGDSGNGMTNGTIAGVLLTDLICGRDNPWRELYDPSRKTLKALPEWLSENVGAVPAYTDWLAAGDIENVSELRPGEGAVIRRGLHKVAVYRDASGELHERSAACPHLGGVVRWNPVEGTWDCPAHGSRFDARGGVVCGPAISDLKPPPGEKDR